MAMGIMAKEIERKFLLADRSCLNGLDGTRLSQGYLSRGDGATVRVRVAGDAAWLTIKGGARGIVRSEYEYPVPVADAVAMLDEFCAGARIDKTRYRLEYHGHVWEIDVFHGANEGLVVAEIELEHEDEEFARPPWLGDEVSDDPRYLNAVLIDRPYTTWGP
jgi:CYTH domain-containing protein